MREIWKDIEGYEGLYQISNLGRVKSFKRYSEGKILKARKVTKGYLQVTLLKNGKGKNKKVHRLVAQAFIMNPNNCPQVNHINGNKTDNTVQNLEWVTNKENVQHAWNNGLIIKNEEFLERLEKTRGHIKNTKYYLYNQKYMTLNKIAKLENIDYGMLWKRVNNEHMELVKAIEKGKDKSIKKIQVARGKKVLQIDLKNNKVIKEWNYQAEITKTLKISSYSIGLCCRGKQKSAGGYGWRYK